MTKVVGDLVTLRSFRESEAPALLEVWGDADWFAPRGTSPTDLRDRVAQRIERSGEFVDGLVAFAIEAEGRLIGEVQARQPRNGLPPGVFELGVELFVETDRGRGLGSAAVAEMTWYLFREEEAIRVQLTTDLDNAPMRRTAERVGYALEGVLRGFMPTSEGPRDYAIYGMTNVDYPGAKERWTSTS
jgi:RimJ/RimL family protein N-acetyltransferase